MTLSTFPKELRHEIVAHLAGSYDGRKAKIRGLSNLFATCWSLNSLRGHIIFHTYYLDIWSSFINKVYPEPGSIRFWNHSAIQTRLAHLQTKFAFVCEIYITDVWDWESRQGAFPMAFMPELLCTLRMLGVLTAVHLVTHRYWIGFNAMIDPDLWQWVVDVKPTTFSLDGYFEIPTGVVLQPIENLDKFSLRSCSNANKALIDLHKPRHFSLTYSSIYYSKREDCFLYKPINKNLESINIEFEITGRMRRDGALAVEPLFDFSGVPQASIKLKVTDMDCHFKNWSDFMVRRLLRQMFVEDVSGYDVQLGSGSSPCSASITIPRRVAES